MKMRGAVGRVLCAAVFFGCSNDPPANRVEAVQPPTNPDDIAAIDTMNAIRTFHPAACSAAGGAGGDDWATCHDETKGYANLLRCAQNAKNASEAALRSLPSNEPASECGREIATASTSMVRASVTLYTDLIAWLEKNRSRLEGPLKTSPLTDVCNRLDCGDQPSQFDGRYELASYATVSRIECTKALFQCGRARDNVCWINKVASRIGVACDPSENKPDDPLFVRSTGTRLR